VREIFGAEVSFWISRYTLSRASWPDLIRLGLFIGAIKRNPSCFCYKCRIALEERIAKKTG
jgi:hypothetical protein